MHYLAELGEKARRAALLHFLPARASDRGIRRDEQHALTQAMGRGEALEERVGVLCEADREETDLVIRAGTVEDHDAARTANGHEAREVVDQPVSVEQSHRRGRGSSRRRGRA